MDKTSVSGKWPYHLASISLLAGLILTLLSWLNICTKECAEEHTYRLFGLPFEWIGTSFFIVALILHFLSKKFDFLTLVTGFVVFSGAGAELLFVLAQKFIIKAWCPVCLGIATLVAIAAFCYLLLFAQKNKQKGNFMKPVWTTLTSISVFAIGFMISFLGLAKFDQLQATEMAIKEKIQFGDLSSPIEVLVFTDWACPACRQIEPKLEQMVPQILKNARLTFVDFVVHPETLNYTPFNLSFMVHNKVDYLNLRRALDKLAEETGTPTEKQVQEIANAAGTTYKELNYAEIALAQKYFEELGNKYRVEGTPTVVIVNNATKKGKKLQGIDEITEVKILSAIEKLNK